MIEEAEGHLVTMLYSSYTINSRQQHVKSNNIALQYIHSRATKVDPLTQNE